MELRITHHEWDGVAVVSLSGDVDVVTAPALREAIDRQVAARRTDLIVDLQEVAFIDSTGLGVLVGRLKVVRKQGGRMVVLCGVPRILRLFEITGLDTVFTVVDDAAEAVALFSAADFSGGALPGRTPELGDDQDEDCVSGGPRTDRAGQAPSGARSGRARTADNEIDRG